MRAFRAELSKLATLPFAWLACALSLIVPVGVAIMNAMMARPGVLAGTETAGPDLGFEELAFSVLGVIVLGAVAIGSEYVTEGEESAGGRQITTSLTAVPSRTRFLIAKAAAVALTAAGLAALAITATLGAVRIVLGDHAPELGTDMVPRLGGVVAYWVLTSLLAFSLSLLLRNAIVPMAVLVANSSVVTVTYLFARVSPVGNFFPDMAGLRMFVGVDTGFELAPLAGGLIMLGWVITLLSVAGIVFSRRDA